MVQRWSNQRIEARYTCRDIKRVSTSRTRRCARSLEELLIEIEKKKENREGGKKREAREEKKKRKKGEGKKKTGLTVKRLPTQSVSFAFQKVIDTLKEIALISTDDSSPLKRYSEKIPLYSSRNEAASNSFSFFYIFPFDSRRSISLNTERPPREEKNRIQRFSIDSSTEIKSNIAYNVIRWRQRPATKLQLPQASFNFINHARSSRVSPGPNWFSAGTVNIRIQLDTRTLLNWVCKFDAKNRALVRTAASVMLIDTHTNQIETTRFPFPTRAFLVSKLFSIILIITYRFILSVARV